MRLARHALGFGRFAMAYRRFLREPMTVDAARDTVRLRMNRREESFARMMKTCVFGNPSSPYLPLLRLAGCELGDIERLTATEGLDRTLSTLYDAGVYFTFEEYKGRKPVVRGGRDIAVKTDDFNNPDLRAGYEGESGGSTGRPSRVFIDIAHIEAQAPAIMLAREGAGLLRQPVGIWLGVLPDPTGLNNLVRQAKWHRPADKWFATELTGRTSWRHAVFNSAVVSLSALYGVRSPTPQPLALTDAIRAARWMAEAVAVHGGAVLNTQPSKAVRVARAATQSGLSLKGGTFIIGGEPVTPAKVASIVASGASYVPLYAFSEHGHVGEACPHTRHLDEVHVFEDTVALTQVQRHLEGFDAAVSSFCYTSLLTSAPKILLNVESDDYGVIERRRCDCGLGELGFRTHVRNIRSFSKLTGEGTTLVGSNLEAILERDLPAGFGGGPLDYQLVEDEDESGIVRLTLLIEPSVPIEEEDAVVRCLLDLAAAAGGGTAILREAGSVRVRRAKPILTGRGKFSPLQLLGRPGSR